MDVTVRRGHGAARWRGALVHRGRGSERRALALAAAGLVFSLAQARGEDPPPGRAGGGRAPERGAVKQGEALEDLQKLEEAMDRLARLLARTEPENALKLREAFRHSRERLVRERMQRVLRLLEERRLDRALETQESVESDLKEILDILLEREIDPRELLEHIRRLRTILRDLDELTAREKDARARSAEAVEAGANDEALLEDMARLEDLIRREKAIEEEAGREAEKPAPGLAALEDLAGRQEGVRQDTEALRARDLARSGTRRREPPPGEGTPPEGGRRPGEAPGQGVEPARGGEGHEGGERAEVPPGGEGAPPGGSGREGQPGEPGSGPREGAGPAPEKEPPAPPPEPVLDAERLRRAARAMEAAEGSMRGGRAREGAAQAREARALLEEASGGARDRQRLERLRRNFPELAADQDATHERTEGLLERMERPVPLVSPPEGGVPGRGRVGSAAGRMAEASGRLRQGRPGSAGEEEEQAVEDLKEASEQVEEALETLQRALRERILAYLRAKFTRMLEEEKGIHAETRSLHLKLEALGLGAPGSAVDRADRQRAERLAVRQERLMVLCEDVLDLLEEDGTTLVFPDVVREVHADMKQVRDLLGRIRTGPVTQGLEEDIVEALEEILRALEEAMRNPPPPNPNQGRDSPSGAQRLLAKSSELKLVRALQLRVNERTRELDARRSPGRELVAEEKLELEALAEKQAQVEKILRKVSGLLGDVGGR